MQNVDVYPTVLAALGEPIPEKRQGVNLIPVLQDRNSSTRDHAIMGQFGYSISITDGEWTLHQAPNPDRPLYWYSHHLSRFYRHMELGPFVAGRRRVLALHPPMPRGCLTTWLTNKTEDPAELVNLVEQYPEKVREMQRGKFWETAVSLAPAMPEFINTQTASIIFHIIFTMPDLRMTPGLWQFGC